MPSASPLRTASFRKSAYQKALILNLIRARPLQSRTTLQARTGLRPATITVHTGELLREELITPSGRENSRSISIRCSTLKHWHNVPTCALLRQHLKCPIFLEEEVRAKTRYEQRCGHPVQPRDGRVQYRAHAADRTVPGIDAPGYESAHAARIGPAAYRAPGRGRGSHRHDRRGNGGLDRFFKIPETTRPEELVNAH